MTTIQIELGGGEIDTLLAILSDDGSRFADDLTDMIMLAMAGVDDDE